MSRGPTPAFPSLHADGTSQTANVETVVLRELAQGAVAAACTLLIVFTILAWALF